MISFVPNMAEDWEIDFKWLALRHKLKEMFNREVLPDLNAILFLVGIQELGKVQEVYTKEEKQDLMHIAVCRLLSQEGYYQFVGFDADGWPHYERIKNHDTTGLKTQEAWMKRLLIRYFAEAEVMDPETSEAVDFTE